MNFILKTLLNVCGETLPRRLEEESDVIRFDFCVVDGFREL